MNIDRTRLRYPLSVAMISLVGVVMIGGNALAAQGDTTRVSVDSTGGETNGSFAEAAISDDGRFVAFHSWADDLVAGDANGSVDVFVHDRETSITTRVSVDSAGTEATDHSFHPAVSGDGRYVAFWSSAANLVAGDTNAAADVFVHDRETGVTIRVSVDSAGNQSIFGKRPPSGDFE